MGLISSVIVEELSPLLLTELLRGIRNLVGPVHGIFHRCYNLLHEAFLTLSGFQIRVSLILVVSVKVVHQRNSDNLTVGFEFLFIHRLQILPRPVLNILVQIKTKVCAAYVLTHGLLLPAKAGVSKIFISLGSRTNVIQNSYTGFIVLSEVPDQTAATANDI